MRVALALFVALAAIAIGTTIALAQTAHPSKGAHPSNVAAPSSDEREAAIYSAVIRELVAKDNPFGAAPPPFTTLYVLDRPIESAGDPEGQAAGGRSHDPFSDGLKAAIRARLTDLPPVEFVATRESVVVGDMAGSAPGRVKNGGVLITLGPVVGDGDEVKVANNWWMSGLAGEWLTYVLANQARGWDVTGTAGPVAMS